jgi:isopentenyl diphosphate isomerase/L-lactate dehydrogenase-like FMN-dependent dehydrogenase
MTSLSSRISSVSDARRFAHRIVPQGLFDYIDGGAEDEVTMAENERAFRSVTFRPRACVRVESPRLDTTVVGTPISMPVLLAPCGLIQTMHPDGALGVIRAAKRAGTISVLSTFSGIAPETVTSEPGPRWLQLYAVDRHMAKDLLDRAAASNFDALVITADSPTMGKRERDIRYSSIAANGIRLGTAMRMAPQVVLRPRWTVRTLRTTISTLTTATLPGRPPIGTTPAPAPALPRPSVDSPTQPADNASPPLVSPFTWEDIAWIHEHWSGPLMVKGILSGPDAVAAVDAGADAVIVSNHGGRQLESAPATLRVLPEVVDAVDSRAEVLVDGGIRRGGDVVKALALGARAVLIGRPYLFALCAAGEAGVERMLEVFRADMARTMVLLGCHSVADLDRTWLQ